MYKIAIVNQKGGTGKTTTSVQLAAGLALRGYRVLGCDLDSQADFTSTMLGDSEQSSQAPTVYDVLAGSVAAHEALVPAARGSLLPASLHDKRLSLIDVVVGDSPSRFHRLAESLEPLSGSFDYVVIDTPPARNTLSYNALYAADGLVVTSDAGEYSLGGITDLAESIDQARRYANRKIAVLGILLTCCRPDTRLHRGMMRGASEIAEKLGCRVFRRPIHISVAVGESQACYTNLFDYAPRSAAAGDYREFIDELIKVISNA